VWIVDVLIVLYLVVAVLSMARTFEEWRGGSRASLPGMLAGCVLCLFWLPLFVAVVAYRTWRKLSRDPHGVATR